MQQELTLYTNPQSRGRIARWMLEEVNASYHTEVLEYGEHMKSPEYLAVNPMGKVPALVDGDRVVTECAAICAYLADRFPAAGLAPPADQRADYYRWLFFAAGPLEQSVTDRFLGVEPTAEQEMMVGYGNFARVMDILEKAVDHDGYIAGPEFTAADLYVGSHLGWGMQFGTLEKRPAFEAYWARVSDRPAYHRANELDEALMPEAS